jgi:hypothetical protein
MSRSSSARTLALVESRYMQFPIRKAGVRLVDGRRPVVQVAR